MARILNSTWQKFDGLLRDGMSAQRAAKQVGISYSTALKHVKAKKDQGREKDVTPINPISLDEDLIKDPIPYDKLIPRAQKAYDDIAVFAENYFGLVLMPWHIQATKLIQELYLDEDDKFVVINCPPGVGKSTFFGEVLPAWLTVRDRTIKGFIGSVAHDLATTYTTNLADHFERTLPVLRRQKDIDRGFARYAKSTLVNDYGRFKPQQGEDIWRQDKFSVVQHNGSPRSSKESTWAAFSYRKRFIGWRADFIIWDDLYDTNTFTTSDQRDKLKEWYINTAETRLDEGGLLLLQGQRLSPDDIYNFALSLPDIDEDEEAPKDFFIETADIDKIGELAELRSEQQETLGRRPGKKYYHIKFKAHYEEKCEGDHALDAQPYPYGCLLYPAKVPYRRILQAKSTNERNFQIVYQQEDIDLDDSLVKPIWLEGGIDKGGVPWPGCYDQSLSAGIPPKDLTPPVISVCTVDPSATNYWAIQWWLYEPATQFRYLVDLHRSKLDASEFLDYNPITQQYSGLMDEWQQRSKSLHFPIKYWIFEHNAAQRWFFRFFTNRLWTQQNNTQVITHQTSANKNDPELGVRQIIPSVYQRGLVRLPAATRFDRKMSEPLTYELTRYPETPTDDCIMSNWFLEWNIKNIYTPNVQLIRQRRPRFNYIPAR